MTPALLMRPTRLLRPVLLVGMALCGFVVLTTPTPAALAGNKTCIERWSDAAPLVAAHALVNVEELTAKAPEKLGGAIVKATLCETNGSYTYALVVRTPKGKLRSVTVDARNPF